MGDFHDSSGLARNPAAQSIVEGLTGCCGTSLGGRTRPLDTDGKCGVFNKATSSPMAFPSLTTCGAQTRSLTSSKKSSAAACVWC